MNEFPHYHKEVQLLPQYEKPTIDVYSVLDAFKVISPPLQHAIKKQLLPGNRGAKDKLKDLREARSSLDRAIEMECIFLGISLEEETK